YWIAVDFAKSRSIHRSADFGKSSTDGTEGGLATDLEEKPQPPPQVPSGTPAGSDSHQNPLDESLPAKAGNVSSKQPPSSRSTVKKKPARSKSSRKKLKAPDSDIDDRIDPTSAWTNEQLESVYHKKQLHAFLAEDAVMRILRPKLLGDLKGPVSEPALRSNKLDNVKAMFRLSKESGIVAGAFEANDLFDLSKEVIKTAPRMLFELLVGGVHKISKDEGPPPDSPGDDHDESSSHYESAIEEVDTDSVDDPPRMTLGPSGTAMLRDRAAQKAASSPTERGSAVASVKRYSPEKLESFFFQSAMGRFLEEQRTATAPEGPTPTGAQDVEMESVGSLDHHLLPNEYDPDDLDLIAPRRAAVATTSTAKATIAPRIRVSAMSELKEFSGKDGDEDRARAWLSKVKSAFVRDQAPDEE
ncbi:hypothetical protein F441_18683, partial [Phytophthora nicotianae CJ01A1]